MAVAKQDGKDYAIVPIAVQVEYPANGSTSTVTLPDNVELLSYTSTAEKLVAASEKERDEILNASYKDSSASASGFYVKATEDFSATLPIRPLMGPPSVKPSMSLLMTTRKRNPSPLLVAIVLIPTPTPHSRRSQLAKSQKSSMLSAPGWSGSTERRRTVATTVERTA